MSRHTMSNSLPNQKEAKNNHESNLDSCRQEGGVILKTPLPSSKQSFLRIHHFFTFNNYRSSDINVLIRVFNEFCYSYAFQEENAGTPHLQGIVSCKKPTRDSAFGLMKAIHWEKPEHVARAYEYCTDVVKRTGNVFVKNYEIPYKFVLPNFFDWQLKILELLKDTPSDRKIYWYWSLAGNIGKSTFIKHLLCNHNCILLTKGKYSDICNIIYKSNMTGAAVIFDLPRNNGNSISYDALESIKNGMITNTKYETGFKVFPSPHVLIFANQPPVVSKLSEDRWVITEL